MKKLLERWRKVPSLFHLLVWSVFGISIGLFISNVVIARAEVIGSSMEPTYYTGDSVFVCRLSKPERGDKVVVAEADGKNVIKRVIGMPGDVIQVSNGRVYIDGSYYEEDYTTEGYYNGGIAEEPLSLKDNEYFIMGDNRAVSKDSRVIGPVSEDMILGVVIG